MKKKKNVAARKELGSRSLSGFQNHTLQYSRPSPQDQDTSEATNSLSYGQY